MSERLLGIGECMVELFPEAPGLWRQGFAGDVFNTLWYARAYLGPEDAVGFHTGLGRDALSAELETFARENGIDTGDSPRFDDRTLGLYAIHLDGGERSFSYWRDTSAARRLAADSERLARRVAGADLVYLSGITLAILPPADLDALHGVLAEARGGRVIAFDPNIRPRLWSDAAHMRRSIERIASLAHVVLPGVEDEALCFGPGSAEDVARRYVELGAGLVVVKDGGRDVLVRGMAPVVGSASAHGGSTAGSEVGDGAGGGGTADRAPPTGGSRLSLELSPEPIAKPLDTTGAGDAFAGAFLAGTLAGLDVETALRRAHDCAATVVMTRGALCPHERLPQA